MAAGTSSANSICKLSPLLAVANSNMRPTRASRARSPSGTRSRLSLPASIFDESRMSLMMVSRFCDEP